jgi:hypothetical protein
MTGDVPTVGVVNMLRPLRPIDERLVYDVITRGTNRQDVPSGENWS